MAYDKDLEDYLNSIPGLSKPQHQRQTTNSPNRTGEENGFREIDVNSLLQQRIMNKLGAPNQQHIFRNPTNPQQPADVPLDMFFGTNQQQTRPEMVFLKEGQKYYKLIPAPESPAPIAMLAGPISNVAGKEFINKGVKSCYVVENHNMIDLSKQDNSKMTTLYLVEAPWIGVILVPESAIIKQNNGKQLLKG